MVAAKMQSERGNVLVEFALIMPVLILILAGIVQFGFLLNAKIAVNSASYEAARSATLSDDPEADAVRSAESYASASLPGWELGDRLDMQVEFTGYMPGDAVKVNIYYRVPLFFSKILPISEGGSDFFQVSGSSVMQIEEKE
jgi:Flp pilus assembly protein TadG